MKKKLRLIYVFCKRYMLINRHIINFATTSLKNILHKEPIDRINNSVCYEDLDINTLVIGAYENEYCLEFLKKVRKNMFHDFFKYNGKFCVTLEEGQYYGLLEQLSEYALSKCDFNFDKEYCGYTVVYTLSN